MGLCIWYMVVMISTYSLIITIESMGTSQAVPFSNCSSANSKISSYQLVRKLAEGKSLMRHKVSHKFAVVIEHTFASEQQLTEYMKRHKNNFSLSHQFYLNAFDCEVITQANLCSRQFRLAEYFEYQSHTLLTEIQSRTDPRRPFSSKEIMSILCSCVLVLSYFNKNQVLHYTLNPQDIIIDEEGVCKVLSGSLSEHQFDFNQKKDFYYAPETLRLFKQQGLANGLTNKSGVFTLGITLLHMIHLRDMSHLYNFNNFTVKFQSLAEQVRKITDSNLQNIVKKMLKPQSYDRISFTQLEQMLFEVLAKTEKSVQSQQPYFQCENYQINKLEESILRLKNQETSHSSVTYQSKTAEFHTKRATTPLATMQKDFEDIPESDRSHMLLSEQDRIVLDEFEQPIGMDYSQTARNAVSSKSLQSKKMQQSDKVVHSQRILSDCSSRYSNTFNFNANAIYRHSEASRQKENELSSYCTITKKRQIDQYPQYVSEVLKEGRYEGYKLAHYRHGFGTFYYNQGGKYCGEWVKNRMQGRGVLYYASGKIAYQGQWKQDRLDGYGVLYNENISVMMEHFDFSHLQKISTEWIKYEGYFKDDMKDGQGTLYLSNGESFRGEFQNDQPNGSGIFKNARGELIKGCWLMGALNAVE